MSESQDGSCDDLAIATSSDDCLAVSASTSSGSSSPTYWTPKNGFRSHFISEDDDPTVSLSSQLTSTTLSTIVRPLSLEFNNLNLKQTIRLGDSYYEAPAQIIVEVKDAQSSRLLKIAEVKFYSENCTPDNRPRRTKEAVIRTEVTAIGRYCHILEFKYEAAIVAGVGNIPTEWPTEFQEIFSKLKQFFKDGVAELEVATTNSPIPAREIVDCRAYMSSADPKNLLNSYLRRPPVPHYSRYQTRQSDMNDFYGAGRSDKIQKGVAIQPAQYSLGSADEAAVRYSHAHFVEDKYNKQQGDIIREHEWEAAFVKTEDSCFLAIIRCKGEIKQGLRDALDDNTTLQVCEILPKSQVEPRHHQIYGMGDVTIQPKELPGSSKPDLVLLFSAHKLARKLKEELATDLGTEALDWKNITLVVKESDHMKYQTAAINNFFDSIDSAYAPNPFRKWWPMFLGISTPEDAMRKPVNFLRNMQFSQEFIDTEIDQAVKCSETAEFGFNPEQLSFLRNTPNSYGGIKLVRGPPGTGKSTTIAMLALTLLRFPGVAVYACAPTNGATNSLLSRIQAQAKQMNITNPRCEPMRMCRKYDEIGYMNTALFGRYKDAPMEIPAQMTEKDKKTLYKLEQQAREAKLMSHARHGVNAKVHECIKSGNLYEAPECHSTSENVSEKVLRQRKHFADAQSCLQTLRSFMRVGSHRHRSEDHDEDREMKVRWNKVKTQVLGTRRLVVSTVGNATNLLLRDSIFRDSDAVVVIVDEQSLSSDVGLLTLLAGLIDPLRHGEFGGKSPIVQLILVGDEQQGAPVVKSLQAEVSVFGPQLALSTFERLVILGVPVENLLEQHRMAEPLSELPNERCYGNTLRDAPEPKSRKVTENEKITIATYFPGRNTIHSRDFRHLILDQRGTSCQREETTGSRFNLGNIARVVDFVKHLIDRNAIKLSRRDLAILVPYNAQKRRYLEKLANIRGVSADDLHDLVDTSDGFQGRERKWVIFDMVITKYEDGEGRKGNIWNERKMNVACTRGMDFFFVIGDLSMLDSPLIVSDGWNPYAIELLRRLRDKGAFRTFHTWHGV